MVATFIVMKIYIILLTFKSSESRLNACQNSELLQKEIFISDDCNADNNLGIAILFTSCITYVLIRFIVCASAALRILLYYRMTPAVLNSKITFIGAESKTFLSFVGVP